MDRIMIIGAGAAQVPLIHAAQEMGYRAVVASIPGNYPGLEAADEVSYTDISNAEEVALEAQRLGVRAVAACCMDLGIEAQALACKTLGLPGPSAKAAHLSANKLAMKEALEQRGVPTARYRKIHDAEDLDGAIAELGMPLVVKAVDLQGSKGIFIVDTPEAAHEALGESMGLTSESYCIAEEYLEGDSIGAEALVQNGRVVFVLPDGTQTHKGQTNIPIGHYAPLDYPASTMDNVEDVVRRAIEACDFDNCAVNVDMIVRNGKAYIIELSARAGATCLPELVSLYFGIDYYRMILMTALGQDVTELFESRRAEPLANASSMIGAPKAGILQSVEIPENLPDNVVDLHFIVEPGEEVNEFNGCIDRIGQIIVTGDDARTCRDELERVLGSITVNVSC